MVCSSVGKLSDWMCETADKYDMATSMAKYLMSQEELTFGEERCEISSAPDESSKWTHLVEDMNDLG